VLRCRYGLPIRSENFRHMKRLRLIIVEDEPLIRAGIRDGLRGRDDVEIARECGSVAEAVKSLRAEAVELALLDVQLPDGNGFDIIRRVGPRQMPAVIFVIAYDQYAIRAFEVNAVDYLLKPFDQERLLASLDRAKDRLTGSSEALARRLEALIQAQETRGPRTLVVRRGERFDFVAVTSIDWIEAANNYAVLHCGTMDYLFGETLANLETRLDPTRFVRVHRSIIVNTARITAVRKVIGGVYEVQLRSGTRVKTGRQYRDRIRRLLSE
jgi:two-component system LytT family response regulator